MVEVAAPNICGGIAGPARGLPNDWMTALLEAPLRERFDRVRVENDCVAALEAERRWGALQGIDHCAYVTWSTGIGVGLCVDGRVLRGKNGNAGHAGHMFVSTTTATRCAAAATSATSRRWSPATRSRGVSAADAATCCSRRAAAMPARGTSSMSCAA